jgi:hypothetical protein
LTQQARKRFAISISRGNSRVLREKGQTLDGSGHLKVGRVDSRAVLGDVAFLTTVLGPWVVQRMEVACFRKPI